jgi:hypothetical protein
MTRDDLIRSAYLPLDDITEPALVRAIELWRSQASNGPPPRRAIDPIALGTAVLPYVFLVDVALVEPRFVYRLVGTAVEAYLGPLRGRTPAHLRFGRGGQEVARHYERVVHTRGPIYCVRDIVGEGFRRYRYRTVVMPLSSDGARVDGLFGAAAIDAEEMLETAVGM